MKTILLSAAILAFSAVPAAGETVHRTSVTHDGKTVSLAYEPQVETRFRQTDIGPRSFPRCLWSAKVSVQRTVTGADNQPIAALSREVQKTKARSGSHVGHCSSIAKKPASHFGMSDAALRAIGAEAARNDTALHTELASLDTFHAAHAR